MKKFSEMDHNEKIDYLTGNALMKLGRGDSLRSIVADIFMTTSYEAYDRGKAKGFKEATEKTNGLMPLNQITESKTV